MGSQLTPICPYVRTPMTANVVAETVEQIDICRVHEVYVDSGLSPKTFKRFLLHCLGPFLQIVQIRLDFQWVKGSSLTAY